MRPTGIGAGNGSEMAQRSKKLTIEGLRRTAALQAAKTLVSATSAIVGATIAVVGMINASSAASRASIARTSRSRSLIMKS